jgi:hypothetical protein
MARKLGRPAGTGKGEHRNWGHKGFVHVLARTGHALSVARLEAGGQWQQNAGFGSGHSVTAKVGPLSWPVKGARSGSSQGGQCRGTSVHEEPDSKQAPSQPVSLAPRCLARGPSPNAAKPQRCLTLVPRAAPHKAHPPRIWPSSTGSSRLHVEVPVNEHHRPPLCAQPLAVHRGVRRPGVQHVDLHTARDQGKVHDACPFLLCLQPSLWHCLTP